MKAREIMTMEPEVVTPTDSVSRAAQIMRDFDVGIVPVVGDSRRALRGVITDRDLAVRHVAERHVDDCSVADHMSGEVAKAGPDDDVREVMRLMQREQVRRIPVVDDSDRLLGIIAQADIAAKVGRPELESVEKTVNRISRPAKPDRPGQIQ